MYIRKIIYFVENFQEFNNSNKTSIDKAQNKITKHKDNIDNMVDSKKKHDSKV